MTLFKQITVVSENRGKTNLRCLTTEDFHSAVADKINFLSVKCLESVFRKITRIIDEKMETPYMSVSQKQKQL